MALHLLHGTFHVTIMEATHARDGESLLNKVVEGVEDLLHVGRGSKDMYTEVSMDDARVGRTRMIGSQGRNPPVHVWNESFHVYCAYNAAYVAISVKDDDTIGADVVGQAKVPVTDILDGKEIDGWYDLAPGGGGRHAARIHVRMQYFDISTDPFYGRGVVDHKYPGVPYTFFRQYKGCKLTLYQDSHVPEGFCPEIFLSGGRPHVPARCWADIYTALRGARHLIYIAGWSVYTKIRLVRDRHVPVDDAAFELTLGELLKQKAAEGVRVNLLVWDDRTSVGVLKKDGLMATHDEDTEEYFKDSEVNCVLCGRNPDNGLSVIQSIEVSTMFTHHQKIVVVDAPLPCSTSSGSHGGEGEEKRRIVSFIGGIDLCDGRYDTQFHSLFRTLDGVHKDDFHQPNFEEGSIEKGGPREPWHDVHCRIEGQAAWDVLHNFEQRWQKQAPRDKLFDIPHDLPALIPPSPVTYTHDHSTWHVQVFRSIDAGAAEGLPEEPEAAARAGLVSGKESVIDRSIQDAYIHAIRRAKNFIYIENQYFLGSCASWDDDRDAGCSHLIPVELALKIASKIDAGERFCVYIVVPMWPEGVPESGSVQAILHWMHRTMEMMYKTICQALEAKGITDESPKDYLSFFCLGNRETHSDSEYVPPQSPPDDSDYKLAQDHRRFMIYVHAKMMIVDDEYIILGSANINQRSMDGGRDSEIAMGAYQPFHTACEESPRGEIHGFRMSLWYEHMGCLDNTFLQPWSLDCIRKVNSISDHLWEQYIGEDIVDLPGHLLTYPMAISNDGTVTEIPGTNTFPDTKAAILGAKSDILPPILTC